MIGPAAIYIRGSKGISNFSFFCVCRLNFQNPTACECFKAAHWLDWWVVGTTPWLQILRFSPCSAQHSTPLPFYWEVQDWSILYTDRLKAMPFSHALLLVLKVCSRSQQRIPKSQAVSPSYPPSTILTCCFKMYCTHIVLLHTASCSAAPVVVSSYTT